MCRSFYTGKSLLLSIYQNATRGWTRRLHKLRHVLNHNTYAACSDILLASNVPKYAQIILLIPLHHRRQPEPLTNGRIVPYFNGFYVKFLTYQPLSHQKPKVIRAGIVCQNFGNLQRNLLLL